MKTLNYVKILLLCVFTIGLASCGDDVYYTMQNSDDKLCGKTWIEEYQTENKDGVEVLCSHQLKFAKADNSGQEIWEYYRGGESRPYETTSRTFTWKVLGYIKTLCIFATCFVPFRQSPDRD